MSTCRPPGSCCTSCSKASRIRIRGCGARCRLLWFKPGKAHRGVRRRAARCLSAAVSPVPGVEHRFLPGRLVLAYARQVRAIRRSDTAGVSSAPPDMRAMNRQLHPCTGATSAPRLQHMCSEICPRQRRQPAASRHRTMPKAMFIFLPLVAFLHMLMYWRPRHRYAEHCFFSACACVLFFRHDRGGAGV